MRTVRCTTPDCPSKGLVRTVPDRRAGPGVVYRPDLFCADCGFALPDLTDRPLGGRAVDPRDETAVRNPPETAARRTKATSKRAR